jgi:single-strand DNA-binding protein
MAKMEFPYLNEVRIAGRVVRDPELRRTNSGVPVSNFKVACSRAYTDENGSPREEVCYVGVAAWQELAEHCKAQLQQGVSVLVEGELKSRLRDNGKGVRRSFVEIRAHAVRLLDEDGDSERVKTAAPESPEPLREREVPNYEMNNVEYEEL